MNIRKLELDKMRNDRHFQFHVEVRKMIMGITPDALKLTMLFAAYAAAIDREDAALKKVAKSRLTDLIHEADDTRNETYGALAERVRNESRHYSPAISEAAMRLSVVFHTYGSIRRKPIPDRISAAYNIIQELKLPKYADDVATLGIGAWINLLETQNNAVEILYAKRLKEEAEKCHIVMGEARIETDIAYHNIIRRIEALMEVEGEADYEQFANMINAIAAKFAVKKHHHHHNTSTALDDGGGETGGDEGAGD